MIGKTFLNKKGQEFKVIERATVEQLEEKGIEPSPKKFYYVVEFTATGYTAVAKNTNINTGEVKDKTSMSEAAAAEREKEIRKLEAKEELETLTMPFISLYYWGDKAIPYHVDIDKACWLQQALRAMKKGKFYNYFVLWGNAWGDMEQPKNLQDLVSKYKEVGNAILDKKLEIKATTEGMKGGNKQVKQAKKEFNACMDGSIISLAEFIDKKAGRVASITE